MLDMDLGSGEYGGYAVVMLRGELDLLDAADVADALEAFAAREPRIISIVSATSRRGGMSQNRMVSASPNAACKASASASTQARRRNRGVRRSGTLPGFTREPRP